MDDVKALRPPLLLTRPQAGSERFARQIRARFAAEFGADAAADWPVTISPLLEIEPTGAALPAANALIITSQSAVGPVAQDPVQAGKPVYCVGERTAQVLAGAGFEVVAVAPDAQTLLQVILAAPDRGRLLHARGAETAFALVRHLAQAGREVCEAVVYEQRPQPPAPALRALLAAPGPVMVPLFSPNSARLFAEVAAGARAQLHLAAISAAAAAPCAGLAGVDLQIADEPSAASLADRLVALARNSSG